MPTPLTDADKVLRNDTGKDIVDKLDAIKDALESGSGSSDHITLTQAMYDALVEAGTVDPNAFYFITDSNPEAEYTAYDNTSSGLTADDVQDAIDELNTNVNSKATKLYIDKSSLTTNVNDKASWDSVFADIPDGFTGVATIIFKSGYRATATVIKSGTNWGSIQGHTNDDYLSYLYTVTNGTSTLHRLMITDNPTGTGKLSINRASGSAEGTYSVAEGYNNTASGNYGSHAEGRSTTASGEASHSEGYSNTASGSQSHVEGYSNEASGAVSHAEGRSTIASRWAHHVFGAYNIADTTGANASSKGTYIEIVGNGANEANRSNARTLDWSGNEVLAGGLKLHTNQDAATLNVTGTITANGGTLDCSSYSDGAIIFIYRPSANKVGIYVKSDTWTRIIPIVPISTVSTSGYVITNNDTEALRGSIIST